MPPGDVPNEQNRIFVSIVTPERFFSNDRLSDIVKMPSQALKAD